VEEELGEDHPIVVLVLESNGIALALTGTVESLREALRLFDRATHRTTPCACAY
jgi:Flp pilus assembly CpaE family ATPase